MDPGQDGGVANVAPSMKNTFHPLNTLVLLRSGLPARDLNKVSGSVDQVQVRVVSPAAISGGRILGVDSPLLNLPREVVARHAIKEGNVVISSRGEFVAGLVETDPSELTAGVPMVAGPLCHVLALDPKGPQELSPGFITWLLGTEYARQHMVASSRGSAVSLYTKETVGSLLVPVLELKTQRGIYEAAKATRILRDARMALAEAESETNNSDLCRLAGIRA